MYAVIKTGGKQHKVKAGDVIEVELMKGGDGEESVRFTPLLVIDDDGKAHHGKDLAKATVTGKLVGEQKGDKVKVFKYKSKSGYSRRQGHRQTYTLVEIEDVSLGGQAQKPAKKAEPKRGAEPEEQPDVETSSSGATPTEPADAG